MTKQIAMQIASSGRAVFPAHPATKAPLVKWKAAATVDQATLKDWWARWPSAMVGLPCGSESNLFVLDLDADRSTGERIGQRTLMAMGHAALLAGPRVMTPGSGLHLYFQHWEGAKNTVSMLGRKIDSRSTGGYIIAPGSVSASGRYLGSIDFDRLPVFPMVLRTKLAPPVKTVSQGRSSHTQASHGEVEELLAHIPPDVDYDIWLSVLMALHERFAGDAEGLSIAEQWSAMGEKYKPGDVARRWEGFTGSGVTWATVPSLAREFGADLREIARKHSGQRV